MFFNPGNVSNSGNGGTGGSGDGHIHSNLSTLNKVTESKLREWDNKSNFSGNYNDLTNKPTIPTVDVTKGYVDSEVSKKADKTHSHSEYATPSYVQEKIAEASLSGGGEVDLSGYATKDELSTKANVLHSHTTDDINGLSIVATSGSYNDLTNKPTIPTVDVDKNYVDTQLTTKANIEDIPNLDGYALKSEIPTVPTKTSELANDSGFITTIPTEYVTENELNAKGYLTEHQDISMKADKTELHTHDNKTVLDGITSTKVTEWNNKSNFDGNYNSLTNKPTIPTVDVDKNYVDTQLSTKANTSDIPSLEGYATETYVTNKIAEASLSGGEVDLSGYATKDELNSSLATKSDTTHNHDTVYAPIEHEHSQYLTSVPSEYVTDEELNAKGYLTSHQDISGKADKLYVDTELAKKSDKTHTHSYNNLTDKPTIPSIDNLATKEELTDGLATKANVSHTHDQYLTEQELSDYALKTEIPTVPTKTSQLTNDSGFINSIPSEYITETELSAKGYLVSSDIVGKANISDLSSVATTGDYNDLLNKPNVTNGKDGENGATFTPNVDTDGNLSWTNDKELENPTTINIKGAKGDKGEQGEKGADGKDGQDGLTTSISLNGTVYSHVDGTITLPDYPTIPTKTSDLINDSEFLTSIPTEYITEAKLNEKGYLTEHQDISGKVDKVEGKGLSTNDYTTEEKEKLAYLENYVHPETHEATMIVEDTNRRFVSDIEKESWNNKSDFDGNYNSLSNKPIIPSIDGLATETYVNNKIIPKLVGNTATDKTLTLTVDKYQYAVLSNGDSINLPSVSSFTEIHLFFKASADLTLTFPSVRWQSIPSITSGHTYEIIFTYVVDEWLAGVICYG